MNIEKILLEPCAIDEVLNSKWKSNFEATFIYNIPKNRLITDINVIVPDKVVQVTFKDGSTEKAVCREPDVFSLETAITICLAKHIMGGSNAYNNEVKQAMKIYKNKRMIKNKQEAEQKRIEKRRAKRDAYKKRRAEKREAAAIEKQIEIYKEAYIRAMKYMNSKDNVKECQDIDDKY